MFKVPEMEPVVVIWAINQRPSVGRALAAVFNTYQEAPVNVLTFYCVPPVWKYPVSEGSKDES